MFHAFKQTVELVNQLLAYNESAIRPKLLKLAQFKDLIMGLEIGDGQDIAFKNDLITSIYKRKILHFEHFYYLKKSEKFYDPDSTGKIEFSIVLPFTNRDWNTTLNCLSSDLPEFFAKKTTD